MSKKFIFILLCIIAALGLIFWFTKDKSDAPGSSTNTQPSNHVYGEGKSGVVLVEYGDFQCPACGQYFPVIKSLKEKYKEDITFQFRHFPLASIHPNAMAAHRAAEAAGKQGKFWEMHDKLYEQQQSWSTSSSAKTIFDTYASGLGLNMSQYQTDFASTETNAIINADMSAGQALGANSTPTFVLDGKKLEENPQDLAAFEKLITDAIAAKKPQ